MLSDLRYPIGMLVGGIVGYSVYASAPDLPANGEIGFLGILAIAHYAMLIGGALIGITIAALIIVVMKRPGASQPASREGNK